MAIYGCCDGSQIILQEHGSLTSYVFPSLLGDGIVHGAFTRLGGSSRGAFSSLNVGWHVGDDPARVEANHEAICRALGVPLHALVSGRQVHGDVAAAVSGEHGGQTLPDTDALITDRPGLLLLIRLADCVPVFVHDPERGAIGLAHAGWKGTLLEIAAKTVAAMVEAYGSRPEAIRAGLGPAIGPCCFEVGEEVIAAVEALYGGDASALLSKRIGAKAHLDLWEANVLQLRAAGVTQIEVADICTCCRRDLYYSHRGEDGHTGRFAAVMGLR